jgi:uncharacterized protein
LHATTAVPPSDFGPTAPNDRVGALDAIRGFALLLILTANMAGFYSPIYYLGDAGQHLATSRIDRIIDTLIFTFVQSESVALFSFLFGLGFALQFLRARSFGVSFSFLYARRLLALVAIGLIHAYLIWMGDIVALYGVLGFFLLLFRGLNLRVLLVLSVILYLLPPARWEMSLIRNLRETAMVTSHPSSDSSATPAQQEARRQVENSTRAYAHGTWLEMTAQRARDYAYYVKHNQVMTVFPLFLLGLYAGRRGVFADIPGHLEAFHSAARSSFCAAFFGVLFQRILYLHAAPQWTQLFRPAVYVIAHTALLVFYISAGVVLYQTVSLRRWMAPLAAAGRMALSNYIFQSVVCTFIFYNYGLALYGKVGPAWGLAITFVVFALQLLLSVLWSRRFRLGPVEWIWRSITYGRPQAIRL